MRDKLLVSFSGGETSAYMAQWLWNNKQDEYEMIFVIANTGEENEETLVFAHKCSEYFGFPLVWVEASVRHGERVATQHRVVDFHTASRNSEPFEEVIKKYGIPNPQFKHCTRELKLNPIQDYADSIGWSDYYTAIGIREDEADRINKNAKNLKLLYPLINKGMRPMTKPKVNFWWSLQPFRLELRGYQGNCKTCFKKSDNKLFQIAKESPKYFDFNKRMEEKYENYTPESRLKKMTERGEEPKLPVRFFRRNRSAQQILDEAQNFDGTVVDDSLKFDLVGGDSCEVFAECNEDEQIDMDGSKETPKPKFKNKSERNAGYQTDAMKIFGNSPLLEKRPEGMEIDEYKLSRKIQSIILKNLFHKGHSPNRKLSGIMGQRPVKYSTAKGFRKSITQRKAS